MEFLTQVGATLLVGTFLVFIFNCNQRRKVPAGSNHHNKVKARLLPEPPGAWPILGHVNLVRGEKIVARTLSDIADKYGPAFMLRLGVQRALVVSSWELIKECTTTLDVVFGTRPRTIAGKYLGYNYALFSVAPSGPYWRDARKIATQELLSKQRLDNPMFKHKITTEVDRCIKQLYSLWAKDNGTHPIKMEMDQCFTNLIFNIVTKMIAGKRFFGDLDDLEDEKEARRFQQAINRFMYLLGCFDISEMLPCLEWLDLQGNVRAMKQTSKELDALMANWVEEHNQKRLSGEVKPEKERDFIDVMLSIFPEDGPQESGFDRVTIIKATSLSLILGGIEDILGTLSWALSLLLNNQHVLRKAQEELDVHVGRDRQVDDSDIKNLVYLHAILKETLRLYPTGPLGVPHEAMEDCVVGGYHIPKGTRLLMNLWKLHRDPRVWSNPDEYQPERFLSGKTADLDFSGRHFEFLPFGAGRRMCPGITMSKQVIHLTLARLLQGFNLMTPSQMPIDMSEGLGLALPRAKPLEVLLTPRLPSKFYE